LPRDKPALRSREYRRSRAPRRSDARAQRSARSDRDRRNAVVDRPLSDASGRIADHQLSGFRPDEVGIPQLSKRWVRGGFPWSFLVSNDIASDEWREQFIRPFLERDIPLFGVAHTTVQRYPDVLTETFMVRQLPPWHENLSKRQVRAPKLFLRDTGLLHTLLGVRNLRDLQAHPEVGA